MLPCCRARWADLRRPRCPANAFDALVPRPAFGTHAVYAATSAIAAKADDIADNEYEDEEVRSAK